MEHSKTISGLICELAKAGYTITIEEFDRHECGKCRIRVSKDGSLWSRIVPYELLDNDGFLMYILELLEKCMEQLGDWGVPNSAKYSSPFMEGVDLKRDENG